MMTDAEIRDLTVEILRGIRSELVGMRGELTDVKGELTEMKGELVETNQRLGRLEQRFDGLLEFAGDRYRDHDRRIGAVERAVAELRERPSR